MKQAKAYLKCLFELPKSMKNRTFNSSEDRVSASTWSQAWSGWFRGSPTIGLLWTGHSSSR